MSEPAYCINCDEDVESVDLNEWCKSCVDNYEPPDDSGECFRGGEATAFQAEQMSAWQRELK